MASALQNLSEYNKEQLPDASEWRFGLVVSEWNDNITENLFNGAFGALTENNVPEKNIVRVNVPGSV